MKTKFYKEYLKKIQNEDYLFRVACISLEICGWVAFWMMRRIELKWMCSYRAGIYKHSQEVKSLPGNVTWDLSVEPWGRRWL